MIASYLIKSLKVHDTFVNVVELLVSIYTYTQPSLSTVRSGNCLFHRLTHCVDVRQDLYPMYTQKGRRLGWTMCVHHAEGKKARMNHVCTPCRREEGSDEPCVYTMQKGRRLGWTMCVDFDAPAQAYIEAIRCTNIHKHYVYFVSRINQCCARYYLEDTIFILKIEDTILSCIFKILFETILS